ncbi:helicase [Candidatus Poribacteria bacterium]|nr:helicase [Candidatus Poribacteria bacterium]
MNIVYFDLETKKLFDEVGGRSNIDKLELAVGVTFSTEKQDYYVYLEENVNDLINELVSADVVVGFNIKAFDYVVLSPYLQQGKSLWKVNTIDMMEHILKALGFRVSLDSLASTTLGETKSADGIQSVKWFRQGQIDKVIQYCKKDVLVTKKLHEYGVKNGFVSFMDRRGRRKQAMVNWSI